MTWLLLYYGLGLVLAVPVGLGALRAVRGQVALGGPLDHLLTTLFVTITVLVLATATPLWAAGRTLWILWMTGRGLWIIWQSSRVVRRMRRWGAAPPGSAMAQWDGRALARDLLRHAARDLVDYAPRAR